MANKKGSGPNKPKTPSTLMKNASKVTKSGENKNPIDNLPQNVGGRDQYGRFTKKDPFRKEADKLFPTNKTDDVEELVSPPKPPKERKPREKKPKSNKPEDQVPFFDDPIFDLGHPEDSDIAKKAQEQKAEGEQRVRRAMAAAVMRNIDTSKKRRKNNLVLKKPANENKRPPTQEELQKLRDRHMKYVKKAVKNKVGHENGANDNERDLTQEELKELRDKHLENAKKGFHPRNKELDPSNDNDDGTGQTYNPSASARASSSSNRNTFNRFRTKGNSNFSGGNRNLPGVFTGNVGPNHAPGMKVINGKVKFKKLKKPKEHKDKDHSNDANMIGSIILGVAGIVAGIISAIQTTLQKHANMIIDMINPLLEFFGRKPIPHVGSKNDPTQINATGKTPTPLQKAGIQTPASNLGPTPQMPSMAPETQSQGANRVRRGSPDVGPVAAPGANEYVQGFKESGTQAQAIQFLISKGWTKPQAAGIAANLQVESGFRTDIKGDGGKAYGIAQWHPDRQQNFQNVYGKDIRQSTFMEQLEFVHYELTQGQERSAGAKLAATTDAGQAAAVVDQFYERSSGIHRGQRVQLAQQYMGGGGSGDGSSNGPTQSGGGPGGPVNLLPPSMGTGGSPEEQRQQAVQQMMKGQMPTILGGDPSSQPSIQPNSMGMPGTPGTPGMPGNPYPVNNSQTVNNRVYRSGGSKYAVSPNTNIFELLATQAGNLRQGKMHPFALPGMDASGVNPMQIAADMSPGGTNGLKNVGQRLFNSPSLVQYRQNFPYSAGQVGQGGMNSPYTNPNVPNPMQQGSNDGLVEGIVGGVTSALGVVAGTIMGGISTLGNMVNQRPVQPGIGQMHIRDPKISGLDSDSSFVQRDMIRPQG